VKILCLGDSCIDFYVPNKIYIGGISLNVAYHLTKIGVHTSTLCSPLGSDQYAEYIKDFCRKNHIGNFFKNYPGKTPSIAIEVKESGEKNFLKFEANVMENFSLKEDIQFIRSHDLVMTSYYRHIFPIFNELKSMEGVNIACDFLDLKGSGGKLNVVDENLPFLKIAFIGLPPERIDDLKLINELAIKHQKLVVVTAGHLGSFAFDGKASFEAKVIKVDKVVDSTGAGDAFIAQFLSTYNVSNLMQSLEKANQYAKEILSHRGATKQTPIMVD
jgi:sugar/nucleoside kinase (ribokinase family)